MKTVLLYESADDVLTKAPAHFPAHVARIHEFHARGEILMVGTFGDPFVCEGVVRAWHIRDWNELLA
jgi:uncharacterized protein